MSPKLSYLHLLNVLWSLCDIFEYWPAWHVVILWTIWPLICWASFCYKVNPKYVTQFEEKGLRFVGRSEDGERMEIMELDSEYSFLFVLWNKFWGQNLFLCFMLILFLIRLSSVWMCLIIPVNHPRRWNVTTSTVGLRNGHICKNLTQSVNLRGLAGNAVEEESLLTISLVWCSLE